MKDPAFLFYPGDWLSGTMLMNRHHKGAYMDLLMAQFNNGHLSIENIKTVLGEKDFLDLWDSMLKVKFVIDDDGKYFNVRLDTEIKKRKAFTESRKRNLFGKDEEKPDIKDQVDDHMDDHMENRNRNIYNNTPKECKEVLIGGVGEKLKYIKDDKQYCNELKKLTPQELNKYQDELYGMRVFNLDLTIPDTITFRHPGEIRYRLGGMFRAAVGDVVIRQGVVYRTGEDKPVNPGEWLSWCRATISGTSYGKMMTPEAKLADLVQFCIDFTEGLIATLEYKRNLKGYLSHMKNAYQAKWKKEKK